MKAKIKETGEVVETMYQDCNCCYCEFPDGSNRFISIDELEYLKPPQLIDWEQRRYEIAKAAMQGMITNIPDDSFCHVQAKECVEIADELIKQLKR